MTEKRVLAWHGDPDLKEQTLVRMREHGQQDRFLRGFYVAYAGCGWLTEDQEVHDWAGCLHGCLTTENLAAEANMPVVAWVESTDQKEIDWHKESERFFGIPEEVGYELDELYELTDAPSAEVATKILEAIPVGADLSHLDIVGADLETTLKILRNAPVPNQEEGQ